MEERRAPTDARRVALSGPCALMAHGLLPIRLGGGGHLSFNPKKRESIMLKKLLYTLAAMATVFALSACNTMTGVGKDVEKGGQKIQEESKETQRKM
jgi:predicted small secreted protein